MIISRLPKSVKYFHAKFKFMPIPTKLLFSVWLFYIFGFIASKYLNSFLCFQKKILNDSSIVSECFSYLDSTIQKYTSRKKLKLICKYGCDYIQKAWRCRYEDACEHFFQIQKFWYHNWIIEFDSFAFQNFFLELWSIFPIHRWHENFFFYVKTKNEEAVMLTKPHWKCKKKKSPNSF